MSEDKIVKLPNRSKTPKKPGACPVCGKPPGAGHKPFCSKRCADLDLGRWLDGGYRIPTAEVPGWDDDGEGGPGPKT
ncbi:MAG: DNA gyrase inhibitor YacG [Alphaproteobacteria bacterium]|nr:DNA gyrase inhibitor YacG [Alphaproteobacteria bacterium]MBF0249919.1 DNA gyrase inhibitor YacG [Alphaproteobacteria bacterium]